jgi:hypothetical protein
VDPPLRLARLATQRVTSSAQLAAAWSPRLLGKPLSADGSYVPGTQLVAMLNAYIQPLGDHDWSFGDPCEAWNAVAYMDNLLAHYFATGGQDLYYLSHPTTHACLATQTCPFLQVTPDP